MGDMILHSAGQTDVGCVRDNNEDAIGVDDQRGLYVLSDGMGGHQGGEVASAIVIETFFKTFSGCFTTESAQEAIVAANDTIQKRAAEEALLDGMGATLDMLQIDNGVALLGHVGDSRVYLFRDGALTRLTRDQSVRNELIDLYGLSKEEASKNPYAQRVTNALGHLDPEKSVIREERAEPGDRYLLCSDGLSGVVSDDLIATRLGDREMEPKMIVAQLVRCALDNGGPDNVSVIVVEIATE